jgi:hypothetical protein
MAVFVARAIVTPTTGEAGLADYMPPDVATFEDVTAENQWAWCHKHVEYIAEQGIAGGYEDGLYHPEHACSRDQMAVFVARAFDLASQGAGLPRSMPEAVHAAGLPVVEDGESDSPPSFD